MIVILPKGMIELRYFLGTIIFPAKGLLSMDGGSKYVEDELLDGQQRLVTLLLPHSCY